MNKGVLMLLKACGIEIKPEVAAEIETMISKAPETIAQVIATINSFDARLARLERAFLPDEPEVVINGGRTN